MARKTRAKAEPKIENVLNVYDIRMERAFQRFWAGETTFEQDLDAMYYLGGKRGINRDDVFAEFWAKCVNEGNPADKKKVV
jgi:hypothetical protein